MKPVPLVASPALVAASKKDEDSESSNENENGRVSDQSGGDKNHRTSYINGIAVRSVKTEKSFKQGLGEWHIL